MKPQGFSLFTQQKEIDKHYAAFECPAKKGCQVAADCVKNNFACRDAVKLLMTICLLFFINVAFSQTVTVKLDNGDYVTQKVVYNSEVELVSAEKLEPTQATYTDIKLNKYKVYSKNQNVYYIKQTKSGYKKFKIKIQ